MSGLPALVDLHNHLIPGVDDGARDLEQSMIALRAMYEQGVRRLVATPHVDAELTLREDAFTTRMAQIDAAWAEFRRAAGEQFPEVEVGRGHEIMLDVPRFSVEDSRVRLGGGNAVLVEFPRLFVPSGSGEILYNLRIEGYVPVVAHPERYTNVSASDLSLIEEWRRVGGRMAVNAGSFVGGFGKGATETVREMLRRGWIDLIGSDYHARQGRPLLLKQAYEQLVEWGGEEQARLLLSENPGRILDGKEPEEVSPLRISEGVWDRVRRIFSR